MGWETLDKTFYSNGKLLLTGEYVVLDGATALAIPTKYGQSLEVGILEKKGIHWQSFDEKNNVWFSEFFNLNDFIPSDPANKDSKTLSKILEEAKKLNPNFLVENEGLQVQTRLDFPRNWGLGTSSTLINNVANWAEVDAFKLLANSFGGSGYDIAAAQNNFPIIYQLQNGKPKITKAALTWNFTDSLFFIHLNKKQNSKEGIAHYEKMQVDKKTIAQISEISNELLACRSLSDFEKLMDRHEQIISEIIQLPTVKQQLFSDYPYTIKSLGAWGGDFVLATGTEMDMEYFREKGYQTIVPFDAMLAKGINL